MGPRGVAFGKRERSLCGRNIAIANSFWKFFSLASSTYSTFLESVSARSRIFVDLRHNLAPEPAAFPMNLMRLMGTSGYIPIEIALAAST